MNITVVMMILCHLTQIQRVLMKSQEIVEQEDTYYIGEYVLDHALLHPILLSMATWFLSFISCYANFII